MADKILMRTRVTNLIHGRRVRWAGEDGVWFDRGGTLEFDGAFPSICRDDAARSALNEEWRRGMVKLVIRTNLSLLREKIPADVKKAWEHAEKHGETLDAAAARKKRREEEAKRREAAQNEAARRRRRRRNAGRDSVLASDLEAAEPEDGGSVFGEKVALPSEEDAVDMLEGLQPLK